jgi:alpha-glucosidase
LVLSAIATYHFQPIFEDVSYQIDFIELEGIDGKPKLEFNAKCIGPKINRIYFRTRSTPLEQFYGLGEQFSFANLKGRIFNTFVREKGIARGDEPLTTLANALFANAGGRYANTYNPSTVAMSTYNRAIYLDTTAYTIWDFSDQWSVNILVWDSEVKG